MTHVAITGIAGFIGAHIAQSLKTLHPDWTVSGIDNLKRRGSERNLQPLAKHDIQFVHGDIRNPEDIDALQACDVLLDCSAEPSVGAGYSQASRYLMNTNLSGTINCLEWAKNNAKSVIFLSTSRVYPIQLLNNLRMRTEATRFVLEPDQSVPGVSLNGVSEAFPLEGARSLYGASKLCSEILLREYTETYGLKSVVNRCGLVAGPGQWARSDQGVVVLWAAKHFYGGNLGYVGYGGTGKQVRDVLHVADLADLVDRQIQRIDYVDGETFNVGGGPSNSISLVELTDLCVSRSGNTIAIGSVKDSRAGDIPYYVSNNEKVTKTMGWTPSRSVEDTLDDIYAWLRAEGDGLRHVLDPQSA